MLLMCATASSILGGTASPFARINSAVIHIRPAKIISQVLVIDLKRRYVKKENEINLKNLASVQKIVSSQFFSYAKM